MACYDYWTFDIFNIEKKPNIGVELRDIDKGHALLSGSQTFQLTKFQKFLDFLYRCF